MPWWPQPPKERADIRQVCAEVIELRQQADEFARYLWETWHVDRRKEPRSHEDC